MMSAVSTIAWARVFRDRCNMVIASLLQVDVPGHLLARAGLPDGVEGPGRGGEVAAKVAIRHVRGDHHGGAGGNGERIGDGYGLVEDAGPKARSRNDEVHLVSPRPVAADFIFRAGRLDVGPARLRTARQHGVALCSC